MARRRRRTGLARVGGITKKFRAETEGFDKLVKNLRRMSDQARVQILEGAVEEASVEALSLMKQLAPRAPGAGTRGYHGADRLTISKVFVRRDSRAAAVGIHRGLDRGWWLKFAEHGTVFADEQPFIKPTGRAMRQRMLDIVAKHWRIVVRKGII